MKDCSILIIKPEILTKSNEVIASLQRRGYDVLSKKDCKGWKEIAKQLYTELTTEQVNMHIKGYDKHNWKDNYSVLVVKHKNGKTLERLNNEKGNFIAYQTKKEDTLRGEFGLPADKNLFADGMTLSYPGIHCPVEEGELERDSKIFKVTL